MRFPGLLALQIVRYAPGHSSSGKRETLYCNLTVPSAAPRLNSLRIAGKPGASQSWSPSSGPPSTNLADAAAVPRCHRSHRRRALLAAYRTTHQTNIVAHTLGPGLPVDSKVRFFRNSRSKPLPRALLNLSIRIGVITRHGKSRSFSATAASSPGIEITRAEPYRRLASRKTAASSHRPRVINNTAEEVDRLLAALLELRRA